MVGVEIVKLMKFDEKLKHVDKKLKKNTSPPTLDF